MKKKMILIGMGRLLAVTAAAGILFWVLRDDGEETVYREAAAVVGNLTVGVTESGSVEIGTKEDTFDLDISALVRDSSDSDSQSSQGSQTAVGAGGGGGMDMGGMNMFNQIFSFASEQSQTAVTSDNTLTVASVEVSVGQEISAGDVLYVLEGDSVSEIAEKLESDVEKAETDLEAAYAEEKVSGLSAQQTYDTSVAYGAYAGTEYQETISKLEKAVTEKEESIAVAQEELSLYRSLLADTQTEYAAAAKLLSEAQFELDYTDKQKETYLYVTRVQNLEQAQSNYDTLEKEVEELEQSIEKTEENLETLQSALKAAERELAQGKLTAQQTLDLRILARDTAQETYDIAMAYVEKEIAEQEEIYADAEERWSLFDGVIQDCAVVAEYDGIVTNVYFEAGDTIQTGDTLVTLYDLEDVTMTVTVAEEDMTDIAKGSAANVVLTAYPDEVFTAVVSDISDASADSSGNVTYEVTVTLQGDEVRKLYQGMTGDVTFITEEVREVLYVPVRAVTEENDKSYVKIKDADGSVRRVEVTTGFTDGVYIEISEGLEEGEIVLIESVVKD